ncbi:MAG: hypothetical protein WD669_11155 [Pirellulales bacterium]
MTISARYFGAVLTAALLAGGATAQDLLLSGQGESFGPADLTLPTLDGGQSLVMPKSADANQPTEAAQMHGDAHEGFHYGDPNPYDLWQHYPAPIESTGTWLRRGFWYAEADAVVWNRMWNRDGQWFAADDIDVQQPTFFLQRLGLQSTNRVLILDGGQPGRDASVRATLGHFLFRDQRNRDHTAEFTAFGGGDWTQNRIISSIDDFGLFVPFQVDGENRSFDGSSRQTMDYSSHYSSFEVNYRVKQRMGKDQLVMDPEGCWHRAAASGFSWDYLVGLRLLDMRDILDWRAENMFAPDIDGIYQIRTDNDMFGFQMGTGCTFDTSRWSVGVNGKGGVYLNHAKGRSFLNYTAADDDEQDFDLHMGDNALSFIGEAHLIGKWHLTPNFSLRASYEMMLLTSTALAPHQATFIPEFAALATTGDPFYHGASFGVEGYW